MWFVLPVPMLPLVVCLAMLLGRRPTSSAVACPPDRLVLTVASCWSSVGPALVLYLAGTRGPQLE